MYKWKKDNKYPEFADTCRDLLRLQALALINGGLDGTLNPAITKLMLSQHGIRDKQEVDAKVHGSIKISWEE